MTDSYIARRVFGVAFQIFTAFTVVSADALELAGSLSGQFDVSPMGSATYSIPIVVPPGTAGMEPKLSLTYNSEAPDGPFGPGWSLSGLSAITRCPATVDHDGFVAGVNFSITDRFCLDGQRLVAVSGPNGENGTVYRLKNDNFTQVISYGTTQYGPVHWIVQDKSGLTSEYGVTANSRHQLTSADVIAWHVNKVSDRNGNYYSVTYSQDTTLGELILARIDYTGNQSAGLAPYNSIRVAVDAFPGSADSSVNYVSGRRYMGNKQIGRLDIYSGDEKVYDYTFNDEYSQILRNNRLNEVLQCDPNGVCLPPTKFTWGSDDPAGNTFNSIYNFSSPATTYPGGSTAPVLNGDWNCDGKTDVARVAGSAVHIFLSTGMGLVQQPDLNIFGFHQPGYEDKSIHPVFTGDFNGDGCTDIAGVATDGTHVTLSGGNGGFTGAFTSLIGFMPNADQLMVGDWNGDGRTDVAGHISGTTIRIYLSSGSSFVFLNDLAIHANVANGDSLLTGDWNGDGLTDFSAHHPGSGTYFYVSTGSNFNTCYTGNQFTNSAHCFTTAFNGGTGAPVLGDWNGDGLTDFGKVLPEGFRACMSNGTGQLVQCAQISAIGSNADSNLTAHPVFAGDFNGDGLTDVARVQNDSVRFFYARLYHDGTLFFEETSAFQNFGSNQGYSSEDAAPLMLGDWNGDGHMDIGRTTGIGFYFSNHTPHAVQRITKIEDGFGKVYTINYAPLTDSTIYTKDGTAPFPKLDLQVALDVVSSFSLSDGLGGASVTSYKYAGLTYDLTKRAGGGFKKMEVKDHESGITTTTWFSQVSPFEGLPYKNEVRLSNGTLISSKDDTWSSINTATGVVFPYANQNVEKSYEINGTLTSTITTNHTFDSFGNQTQLAITRSDGSSETTINTFDNDTTNWLIGQLKTATVTKIGSGTPVPPALTKHVAFNYLPTTGLLQSETIEPGHPTLELVKSYQYDSFGNITQKTVSGVGITARTETTGYDTKGRFPTQVTNALNQAETRQFDPRFGKVTSLTGPNNLTTTWQYDVFGRVTLEHRADGTETTTSYEFPGVGAPANAIYFLKVQSTGSVPILTYTDELGREIRKETTGFNGQKIFVDKVYDEKGYLTHTSDPYFENTNPLWTVNEYDDIGRTVTVTQPGNRQTHTAYNGLTTTITNPLNQTAIQTVDVQGFVLSSKDNLNNVLTFKNDSYGNPIQITDPLSNVTTIGYDLQGKKTSLVDPDTGTTTYTYDALGQLLTQTNALNQTTTFTYDKLGRITQRQSSDGTESWLYDTALNGVGKLASVTGLHGYQEVYSYDSLGRPSQTVTTVNSKIYLTSQTYDTLGKPSIYTYPSNFAIKNIYNSLGYLSEIKRVDTNASIWKMDTVNAKGQLEQQTFGNGLVTQKTYNPNTGFLTHIQTGTAIQDLTFVYDAIGNLTERQDVLVNAKENFGYDALNRLTSATVFGQSSRTVTYNAIGNILSRSDVGTYSYVGYGPHAVSSITGALPNTYTYDAAGNRTASSDGVIQYSVSGKPLSLSKGTSRLDFDLDPQDQRVVEKTYKNNVLSQTKTYIGSTYEAEQRGTTVKHVHYIKGADGLVAVYTFTTAGGVNGSFTMRYVHLDHLGSIQTITNASAASIEVSSFDAWGTRRDPVTWAPATIQPSKIDKGFTGHEHLEEVSLIHMNGRVYDPIIGRFVSADPYIQYPNDLQSYNRYSYVLNNPLSLTDPTGYFSFKKFWKSFKTVAKIGIVIGVGYLTVGALSPYVGSYFGAIVKGLAASITTSITSSVLNGGSVANGFHAGIKAAPLEMLQAAVTYGIGHGSLLKNASDLEKAFAHGVSGGVFSTLKGEKFSTGFVASTVGGYAEGSGNIYITALATGTAAAMTGGKFEEGAMRGAFIYLFNKMGGAAECKNPQPGMAWNGQLGAGASMAPLMVCADSWNAGAGGATGLDLFGLIDSIGAWSSTNSEYLQATSDRLFKVADQGGFFSFIPRFGGIMIGSIGAVGASPSNPAEAMMQFHFLGKLVHQGTKFFTTPSSGFGGGKTPPFGGGSIE
jgi:RHS repeat-associated protein